MSHGENITICNLKDPYTAICFLRKQSDHIYRRRIVFAIFIQVPVSLSNNLTGVAFVISSALLCMHFVFAHLSLLCSVCGDSSGDL